MEITYIISCNYYNDILEKNKKVHSKIGSYFRKNLVIHFAVKFPKRKAAKKEKEFFSKKLICKIASTKQKKLVFISDR